MKKVKTPSELFGDGCFVIEMDFLVCHPVVKVSIVDGATGYLLQKSGDDN